MLNSTQSLGLLSCPPVPLSIPLSRHPWSSPILQACVQRCLGRHWPCETWFLPSLKSPKEASVSLAWKVPNTGCWGDLAEERPWPLGMGKPSDTRVRRCDIGVTVSSALRPGRATLASEATGNYWKLAHSPALAEEASPALRGFLGLMCPLRAECLSFLVSFQWDSG